MVCEHMNDLCKEQFRQIHNRLDDGDKILNNHTAEIATTKANVNNLIKSMHGLTKALWGVCGTMFASLLSFLFWYIQHI